MEHETDTPSASRVVERLPIAPAPSAQRPPVRLAARHPITSFFALTYALSWGLWLPIVVGYDGALREAFFVAGIFGPALAGALMVRAQGGSVGDWLRGIVRWRVAPRWWGLALVIPAFLIGMASAVYALLGNDIDVSLLPGRLGGYLPALLMTALLGGGQEEFGWRGYALPRLEARYSPVAATLILGTLWGLWHLPVVAADPEFQHGLDFAALVPVVALSLVSVIGYAFLLTWLFNRTGSVLVAMLFHAGFNTANEFLAPLPMEAVEGAAYEVLSVTMTATLVAVVLALITFTRGRLGWETAVPERAAESV
jgi:membrane protease YdiL (CAAX protease family)